METMVSFYRDIIGFKTNWNGDPNAELDAGNCRLIMFGRNDFEIIFSKSFDYPKGLNGTIGKKM
jgi:catechol-2,3-dioxygenase